MKTLRFIGMAVLLAVVSFGFTACSGDDDDPESLLGTWRSIDVTDTHSRLGNIYTYITFYDNGSFLLEDVVSNEYGEEHEIDEEYHHYVAKDGKLYFYSENTSYIYLTSDYSVKGNTLKLTNMTPGHDEGGYGTPDDPDFVNHLTMKKTTRPHWLDD